MITKLILIEGKSRIQINIYILVLYDECLLIYIIINVYIIKSV